MKTKESQRKNLSEILSVCGPLQCYRPQQLFYVTNYFPYQPHCSNSLALNDK